ncbi:hypothetical protein D3C75_756870 [compost metagenome]
MLQSEFEALKEGDKVAFNGDVDYFGIQKGTVLTRKSKWLDDDVTRAFTYGDSWDFFGAYELELIKE